MGYGTRNNSIRTFCIRQRREEDTQRSLLGEGVAKGSRQYLKRGKAGSQLRQTGRRRKATMGNSDVTNNSRYAFLEQINGSTMELDKGGES